MLNDVEYFTLLVYIFYNIYYIPERNIILDISLSYFHMYTIII